MTDIPSNHQISALDRLGLADKEIVLQMTKLLLKSLSLEIREDGRTDVFSWKPEDLSHDAALTATANLLNKSINAFVWEVIASNQEALNIFNQLITDSGVRYGLRSPNVMILAENMKSEITLALISLVQIIKISQTKEDNISLSQEELLTEALAVMVYCKLAADSF